eukprot:TRINITY_DN10467_c0_g1_i1.p1 TRINITY_DN10467_c0_g1~~TRINITY_DN10467_c0_g1_i1.p1  ORF type:complete len:296 (-),score=72.46 TRINITY_DN10467_c0_g1_i1:93-980(-)
MWPSTLSVDSSVELRNGVHMPVLGLGLSYQGVHAPPGTASRAVGEALRAGYRMLDTAKRYGNEREVGIALSSDEVRRDNVFVTSKLWCGDYGSKRAQRSYSEQCAALGVERMDLFLLHFPSGSVPSSSPARTNREVRAETWRALETMLDDGRVRAIGVSNFLPAHLDQLEEDCSIVPHVNQMEYNPFQQQTSDGVKQYCDENGIQFEGYCPLAKGHGLQHPVVGAVAEEVHRSCAQVLIRWSLQQGVVTIPKASQRPHILDNLRVFDFSLSPEQMDRLSALDCNLRVTWDPTGVP